MWLETQSAKQLQEMQFKCWRQNGLWGPYQVKIRKENCLRTGYCCVMYHQVLLRSCQEFFEHSDASLVFVLLLLSQDFCEDLKQKKKNFTFSM